MHKIAIIGGGPACVSLCIQFFNKFKDANINKNLEILVFEKNNNIGCGSPYLHNNDCHILNLPKEIMEPCLGEKNIFANWLRLYNPDFDNTAFPPRHYFGKYLQDYALNTQRKSEKIGLKITYLTNHNVLDIKQINSNLSIICTNKQIFEANFVVLSTGHMPSTSFTNFIGYERYFHNPWDDKNIYSQINPEATIGIIGTRLTAIDVVLKLKSMNHKGKIYMASRSGLLPAVLGKEIPEYELKYINLSTIQKLTKNWCELISLEVVLSLFWKELENATGRIYNFSNIAKSAKDISPLEWLNNEINSSENGGRAWQSFLFALYPITPHIWCMLNFEDKKIFLEKYYSIFITYLAAFPVDNAYKMRNILKSKQLEVYGGLKNINVLDEKFSLQLDDKSIVTDFLFNATGPGYDPSSITLYKNMLNHNLIEKNPLGGIKVNTSTFQVLDKNNNPNASIFAIGELAKGDCFLTTDLGSVASHSYKVSEYIVEKIDSF